MHLKGLSILYNYVFFFLNVICNLWDIWKLVSKNEQISGNSRKINKFYNVAPKYVSMKMEIGINV